MVYYSSILGEIETWPLWSGLATIFSKSEDDDWNEACQELQRFAVHWKKIGRALGLAAHLLDEIEADCSTNSARLDKMIEKWIGQNYNTDRFGMPSWRTLCKAVSGVADMKHFKELAENHKCKMGCCTTNVHVQSIK